MVVGGTTRDIVFWDIRKIKHPLDVLESSHNEDVTACHFHPLQAYHQRVITCSTDCQLNFFDFAGKESMNEGDGALEAVYASDCPLIDCGFVPNKEQIYALTSINTLEILDADTALLKTKIAKF